MITFIIQRVLQSILVMLTVALIAFGLFRYVGDPINNMVGQDTTIEERAELRERLGLNDAFLVQFGRFAANAAKGEFGFSYQHRRPVSELIAERLPATLELSLISAILALVIGIPMGVYTAIKRHGQHHEDRLQNTLDNECNHVARGYSNRMKKAGRVVSRGPALWCYFFTTA